VTRDTIPVCAGDSIDIQGQWFTADTVITSVFPRAGCDSLHYMHVRFLPPLAAVIDAQDPCEAATGSIRISMTSGAAPFQYAINGGPLQDEPYLTGLAEGVYALSIVDARGCRLDTTVTLTAGAGIGSLQVHVRDATCGLDNGSVSLRAATPGILYAFDSGNFSEDSVFMDLAEGTYPVIALHPAGCRDTLSVLVDQSGKPAITDMFIQPTHCGRQDGTIHIGATTGGAAPYAIGIDGRPADTLMQLDGLSPGFHIITIVDAGQCKVDTSVFIPDLPGPEIADMTVTPALCGRAVGAVALSVVDTAGVIYQLDDGDPVTVPVFTGLQPGLYSIHVTDSAGCSLWQTVTVPDSFSFSLDGIRVVPGRCQAAGGTISLQVSGAPVEVMIDELPGQTFGTEIAGLREGMYHLRLRDAQMCMLDTVVAIASTCEVTLPNVFSPNGDGVNDVFGEVRDMAFDQWELTVFDRSGNMVFYSGDPHRGWNGEFNRQKVLPAAYVWTLRYKFTFDQQVNALRGDVTVMR
jgi:gliding motility-associated-like protein